MASPALAASCPHALALVRRSICCGRIGTSLFGVHLTLVGDFADYRWGPVTARDKVPSLLDSAGNLFTTTATEQLLRQARVGEVELELRSQIESSLLPGWPRPIWTGTLWPTAVAMTSSPSV